MPSARACLLSALAAVAAFSLSAQAFAASGDAAPATDSNSAPVASAGSKDVNAQIKDWIDASPEAAPTLEAAEGPSGPPDRAIHGEWGVGVGTGGYRSAYGVAVIPLGDRGAAVIAASTDHYNGRRWGMNGQSFGLSIDLDDAARSARLGSSCPFDRYSHGGLEPSWVGPLRGRDDRAAVECAADGRGAGQECTRPLAQGHC